MTALCLSPAQNSTAQTTGSSTSTNSPTSATKAALTINLSEEEFKAWQVQDNKAKDFNAKIVDSDDNGKKALQLQYNIQSNGTGERPEVPSSISLVKAALGAQLTFSNDKPVFCDVRVKASQNRTIRIGMTDATSENFFTEQFMVTTDWQTISIPISQGFWNHWYSTPDHGAEHDQVVWPLTNFSIDLLFTQSAGQFKDAGGASTNLPETFWIESVAFRQ